MKGKWGIALNGLCGFGSFDTVEEADPRLRTTEAVKLIRRTCHVNAACSPTHRNDAGCAVRSTFKRTNGGYTP